MWGGATCTLPRGHDKAHLATAGGSTMMWTDAIHYAARSGVHDAELPETPREGIEG